ncbi:MAG: transposase [Thermodesulfobacteriota bacterium]
MKYDPRIHHRRSIRLKDYDYATAGAYFVTICTQHRECLFGEIVAGVMRLNDAGNMIQGVLSNLFIQYTGIEIDEFIVMPNHIHVIIFLNTDVGAGPSACPQNLGSNIQMLKGQPRGVAPTMSLPDLVHRFKSLTTSRYIHGVKQKVWRPFPGKLWQRNYYEHIIRNEYDLNEIREYIVNNPLKWELDKENPENIKMD